MADTDSDEAARHEELAFEHEMLTAANLQAEHWEKLGPPTGPSTAAFILLAARTFVSSEDPLSRQDFLELTASLFDRAKSESDNGELLNIAELNEAKPALN